MRAMIGYVTIRKFSELTGYTEDAIRTKIKRGAWLENRGVTQSSGWPDINLNRRF